MIRFDAPSTGRPSNAELADRLEEIASLLQVQEAGPYRIQAYRAAARMRFAATKPHTEPSSELRQHPVTKLSNRFDRRAASEARREPSKLSCPR